MADRESFWETFSKKIFFLPFDDGAEITLFVFKNTLWWLLEVEASHSPLLGFW